MGDFQDSYFDNDDVSVQQEAKVSFAVDCLKYNVLKQVLHMNKFLV